MGSKDNGKKIPRYLPASWLPTLIRDHRTGQLKFLDPKNKSPGNPEVDISGISTNCNLETSELLQKIRGITHPRSPSPTSSESDHSRTSTLVSRKSFDSRSSLQTVATSACAQELLPLLAAGSSTVLSQFDANGYFKGTGNRLAGGIKEYWITTEEGCVAFTNVIMQAIEEYVVTLSLDGEGDHMGRNGTLSQITINLAGKGVTFHLDTTVLGDKPFNSPGSAGKTFGDVLEDPIFPLLIYDSRGDSDALYHHAKVNMGGVIDLQIMKVACLGIQYPYMRGTRFYLPPLWKCVRDDLYLVADELVEWKRGKDEGREHCEKFGWSEYDRRPLPDVLKRYAAGDVVYMPHLYAVYHNMLKRYPMLMDWVIEESKRRVLLSTQPQYGVDDGTSGLVPESFAALDMSAFVTIE